MEKKTQFNIWYIVLAFMGILLLQSLWLQSQRVESIPYSEFQDYLKQGQVQEVTVTERYIHGTLREPLPNGENHFITTRIEDASLVGKLDQYGVTYAAKVENTFLRDLLSWVLPVLLFLGIWFFVLRRFIERQGMGGGFMSVGRSKAKVYMEKDTKVTFDDVAGVDEAKEELEEIVSFLREPGAYGRLGARIPKGVLLVGPPGTGKTLLARAVAGEAAVPFFSINGSEFVEMFVGVGAARVRDLFEQARQNAPCIIFVDELEALGRARGIGPPGGGHEEKEQTLSQLLAELDGFDPSVGIVLLAATNRPEILDTALLRAGRFDRQILVDRPDKTGRVAILKVHLKKIDCADDADPEQIAALTPGFSGADLANLVNEAAVVATREDARAVTLEHFTKAIERIVAGLEKKNRLLNPHEREVVAYHEMGHALIAMSLPGVDPVHKVSIIPHGIGALGYTIQRPTEDRYLMTRDELENKMTVLLGGRAAEGVVFDEMSTGAADDLVKATNIATSMMTRYGMDEKLGNVAYETEPAPLLGLPPGLGWQPKHYSEETARKIDHAVREAMRSAFDKAVGILRLNQSVLEEGAQALLTDETLTEDALKGLKAKLITPPDSDDEGTPVSSAARGGGF